MQLQNVTLFCFFASYVVALALEALQLLKKLRINRWAALVFAGAGLIAQTAYLFFRSQAVDLPPLLTSGHDWLLVLAWLAVALYIGVELWNRELALGIFVLPAVLVLIGTARFVSDVPHQELGSLYWLGLVHASLLVLGFAGTFIAVVLSVMYLVQHRRLKSKRAAPEGLHLLSLESLARLNWWAVVISVPLLTLGMAIGVWLLVIAQQTPVSVPVNRPDFIVNGLLWVAMMTLFVWLVSSRRRAGRLVAWRTMCAGGLLIVTILLLKLLGGGGIHGSGAAQRAADGVPAVSRPDMLVSVRTLQRVPQ
ncbi:hypothetical protein [Maioricimonas sp. JC845]|uniref:hypothetical protein n=1 Tax=Maioricimonas sp. JC845 TaxID=3232138 RepID=UPI00345AB46D